VGTGRPEPRDGRAVQGRGQPACGVALPGPGRGRRERQEDSRDAGTSSFEEQGNATQRGPIAAG
jgi:hypothetical protein